MSDVIDINDLRNKITEEEKEAFREFIFNLYDEISCGTLFIGDITEKINGYGDKQGISREKLLKLKENLIEELTFEAGVSLESISENIREEDFGFPMGEFDEISIKGVIKQRVLNGVNDLMLLIEGSKIYIISSQEPVYDDPELNEVIDEYKVRANLKEVEVVFLREIERFRI